MFAHQPPLFFYIFPRIFDHYHPFLLCEPALLESGKKKKMLMKVVLLITSPMKDIPSTLPSNILINNFHG